MRSFGDLSSTVADLLKFMRALIRGKVFDDKYITLVCFPESTSI